MAKTKFPKVTTMAKRKQIYPKVLYVVREKGSDGSYLVPYDSPAGAAELFYDVEVAVYRFEKTATIKTTSEVV